jgi:DNA-binding transcriptional LysR family regulator
VSVVLRGRLKVTAAEGIREAVNRDLGLAVSSEWNFSPELRSGKVVEVLPDWALPMTNLSAVYPTGRLASTRARLFVAFVEQYMGAMNSVSRVPERPPTQSVQEGAGRHTQQVSRAAVVADR